MTSLNEHYPFTRSSCTSNGANHVIVAALLEVDASAKRFVLKMLRTLGLNFSLTSEEGGKKFEVSFGAHGLCKVDSPFCTIDLINAFQAVPFLGSENATFPRVNVMSFSQQSTIMTAAISLEMVKRFLCAFAIATREKFSGPVEGHNHWHKYTELMGDVSIFLRRFFALLSANTPDCLETARKLSALEIKDVQGLEKVLEKHFTFSAQPQIHVTMDDSFFPIKKILSIMINGCLFTADQSYGSGMDRFYQLNSPNHFDRFSFDFVFGKTLDYYKKPNYIEHDLMIPGTVMFQVIHGLNETWPTVFFDEREEMLLDWIWIELKEESPDKDAVITMELDDLYEVIESAADMYENYQILLESIRSSLGN